LPIFDPSNNGLAPGAIAARSADDAVLTLSSALVLTLMILVPPRPARENVISMPRVRRNVCVRRRRPASARGLMGSASMMLSIAA
jgi:hypothetical protein